ncbi:MAG: hypothetical protein ACLQBA_20845 [Candidatus Binataceae bacterium]
MASPAAKTQFQNHWHSLSQQIQQLWREFEVLPQPGHTGVPAPDADHNPAIVLKLKVFDLNFWP